MEALLQMASYIGAGLSYARVHPRGSLHRQETLKAQTQVQAVLLGGWFSSKLIAANCTKQFWLISVVIWLVSKNAKAQNIIATALTVYENVSLWYQ